MQAEEDRRDVGLLADLTGHSPAIEVRRIGHAAQTNRTYLLNGPDGGQVAKVFTFLTGEKLAVVADIHRRLSGPPCLAPVPLEVREDAIVFPRVEGLHVIPSSAHLPQLADAFAHHLEILEETACPPVIARPREPPRDLRQRIPSLKAEEADAVESAWRELSGLDEQLPIRVAHLDWRPDNFIWQGDRLAAVLDWDSVGSCPLAEAVVMAAVKLSDSRRLDSDPDPTLAASFVADVRARLRPAAQAELEGGAARRAAFLASCLAVLPRFGTGSGWTEAQAFAATVTGSLTGRP